MSDQKDLNELEDELEDELSSSDKTDVTHGWLEQFQAWEAESFDRLEEVVNAGLSETENKILVELAAKLIRLASVHDPEAADKVLSLL